MKHPAKDAFYGFLCLANSFGHRVNGTIYEPCSAGCHVTLAICFFKPNQKDLPGPSFSIFSRFVQGQGCHLTLVVVGNGGQLFDLFIGSLPCQH